MVSEFRSKIDLWLVLVVGGALVAGPIVVLVRNATAPRPVDHPFVTAGLMVIPIVFVAWLFLTTKYVIDGKDLQIICGPIKSTIPIASIRRIKASHNVMSAPALSLDRLELSYGMFGMALVSPKAKHEFIHALLAVAPKIELVKLDEYR